MKGIGEGLTKKKGSSRIYFDFYYHGVRVERSSGRKDTPENRVIARRILAGMLKEIEEGTFVFAEAFPGASDPEKAFHQQFERRTFVPRPAAVTFGDYVEGTPLRTGWKERVLANLSQGKKHDYEQALQDWILPYFRRFQFSEISGVCLQEFVAQLRWRDTWKKGRPLSPSRIRNIMIPLRKIWRSACHEYDWTLRDPFDFLADEKVIPQRKKHPPQVFRYSSWRKLLDHMDEWHRPIAELIILTGMIASEVAGLRKHHVRGNTLHIPGTKTAFRPRDIPITRAIRKRLDLLLARSGDSDHVVVMQEGDPFVGKRWTDGPWRTAFRRAKLKYVRPYGMRHTFAAWAMTIRIDVGKLEKLMGHGSKQMIFEVYGKYVEGLEGDASEILSYFGEDFLVSRHTSNVSSDVLI